MAARSQLAAAIVCTRVLCSSTTHWGGKGRLCLLESVFFVLLDQTILALLGCSCMRNCNCSYALASGSGFSHSTANCRIFGVFGAKLAALSVPEALTDL